MLPSFDQVIKNANLDDVGYQFQSELVDEFDHKGIPYVVLDAKKVLLDPESVLMKLCDVAKISCYESMLGCNPSKRKEDGVWANC